MVQVIVDKIVLKEDTTRRGIVGYDARRVLATGRLFLRVKMDRLWICVPTRRELYPKMDKQTKYNKQAANFGHFRLP